MTAPADLSDCAREPIHIPGSVQPHGCLLSFDPDAMVVWQASANTEQFLGLPWARVAGASLRDLLPLPAVELVREQLADANRRDEALRWSIGDREMIGLLHRRNGLALLEVEQDGTDDRGTLAATLVRGIRRLSSAASLDVMLGETTTLVQELTGFERVMVYKFDEDDHGEVIAERRAADLEAYLGLHYPESDIPRQARALYLHNWVRAIPDARYEAVPIVPALRPDSGLPLDLSNCGLRSVSPVHLEYLANMGVQASMSVSLVVGQRLWGLISCGHRKSLPIPHRMRSACETIGRLVSSQIAALQAVGLQQAESVKLPWMDALVAAMSKADADVLRAQFDEPEALLKLVDAHGAAVVSGESVTMTGRCPELSELLGLAEWARAGAEPGGRFHSHAVPEESGIAQPDAAGLLAVTLPGPELRCLLWFRPEVVQTVNWGGNPDKAVCPGSDGEIPRLHPRRSFALWKETVKGRSLRWGEAELRAAGQLRRYALEIDLESQVRKEKEAVRLRDELVAVVSHDLRTPMSVVVLQAAMIQRLLVAEGDEQARRLRASAQIIQRAGDRMAALLNDLLDIAKIEAGRYQVLPVEQDVETILADAFTLLKPVAQAKSVTLSRGAAPDVAVQADPERVFQVLANLVGNAIKFSPRGGEVTMAATVTDEACEFSVRDQGPGIPAADLPHIFDRYWQAKKAASSGAGLGLYISLGIIQAHGGRMWVESVEGEGATFRFTLPRA
jgi:chemotaxis family two-component system sensor kinase Cph1